jgi:hypothetical protein
MYPGYFSDTLDTTGAPYALMRSSIFVMEPCERRNARRGEEEKTRSETRFSQRTNTAGEISRANGVARVASRAVSRAIARANPRNDREPKDGRAGRKLARDVVAVPRTFSAFVSFAEV